MYPIFLIILSFRSVSSKLHTPSFVYVHIHHVWGIMGEDSELEILTDKSGINTISSYLKF